VGTPPNGITVADLAQAGIVVTFFDWAYYGMPFVVLFLPLTWFILIKVFKPEIKQIAIADNDGEWTKKHKTILLIGFLTIIAWVTSSIHGVGDSSVAIISVVILYALSLLETDDVSKIEWSALLLFGGGLALGSAIDSSGLGTYLGSLLGGLIVGQSLFVVFVMVGLFAVLMTLSASNTATAALIVPLVIPVAKILGLGLKPLAIIAGMGTSLDFLFPVGTPPSAIAFSTGYISVKDMFKVGLIVTISGILLLSFLAWLYW
jgi:sodium-dependent dicarboxylate transporter 2/3/5